MTATKQDGCLGWRWKKSLSDIASVYRYHQDTGYTTKNISFGTLWQLFNNAGSFPAVGKRSPTSGRAFSDLRGACFYRAAFSTTNETPRGVYSDNDNGTLTITADSKTANYILTGSIPTSPSTNPSTTTGKSYAFSKDGGANYVTQTGNSKTYSNLNSGNYSAKTYCNSHSSLSSRVASYTIEVTFNAGSRSSGWITAT